MIQKHVSLSKKILFLLPLTLVLTLTPILFIAMNRTTRDMEMLYQAGVKDIFKIYDISVHNSIQIQELFKTLVANIPEARMDMIGQAFFEDLKELMEDHAQPSVIKSFLEDFSRKTKTHNYIFQKKDAKLTEVYTIHNTVMLSLLPLMRDENGRDIYEMLKEVDDTGKGNIIFIPRSASLNDTPYLFHVFPFSEKNLYLFSFFNLDNLARNLNVIDDDIRERMHNFVTSLDFLDDGFTISYDRTSKSILSRSSDVLIPPDIAFSIPRDQQEGTVYTLDNGDTYILFTHASKDDNLLLTAVAQSTIDDIVHNMVYSQLLACIGVFIVGCIFASVLAHRLLAPMQHFTQLIRQFSTQNVTNPDPTLVSELPLHRQDEIGEMARAFSNMTILLHKNVQELVHMTAKQSRVDGELLAARQSQEGFLPAPWSQQEDNPFYLDAILLPAKEVGGDLYDYFMIDNEHVCLCIGDVSGKGMPAALVMGATTMLVRTSMQLQKNPSAAMHFVNNELCKNNSQQMFVSLFLGVYCVTNNSLTFTLAGHPAPIIFHPDENHAASIPVSAPDLVVGLMPDITYHPHTVTLTPGARLLLFTDGITEAQDTHDAFYGDARLIEFCTTHKTHAAFLQELMKNVKTFTKNREQNDDITALLLSTQSR